MQLLEEYKKRVEVELEKLIPTDSLFCPSLYKGGRYTLLAPAKRIRPLIVLATCQMVDEEAIERALIPACALEMIHTYSLIHDDLPCMDDDDLRRGLPTLHKVYSEGHAVLIGDYLLTYAFEVLSSAPLLNGDQKLALITSLARASGGEGMIGGQVMDIEQSEHIEEMHLRKSAALFCAAAEFGAIIGKASSDFLAEVRYFGMQFGKLFQLVDDLHDDDHPIGREHAELAAHQCYQKCLDQLLHLPGDSDLLKQLTDNLFHSGQLASTH